MLDAHNVSLDVHLLVSAQDQIVNSSFHHQNLAPSSKQRSYGENPQRLVQIPPHRLFISRHQKMKNMGNLIPSDLENGQASGTQKH
jgi:hypothetical protein